MRLHTPTRLFVHSSVTFLCLSLICLQDIMTDLNAESELLPLNPVNEDFKGHKVGDRDVKDWEKT